MVPRRRKTRRQAVRRPGCYRHVAPPGLETAESRCGPRDNRGLRPTAVRLPPWCRCAGVTGRTRLATQRFHGRHKDPIKTRSRIQHHPGPQPRSVQDCAADALPGAGDSRPAGGRPASPWPQRRNILAHQLVEQLGGTLQLSSISSRPRDGTGDATGRLTLSLSEQARDGRTAGL